MLYPYVGLSLDKNVQACTSAKLAVLPERSLAVNTDLSLLLYTPSEVHMTYLHLTYVNSNV